MRTAAVIAEFNPFHRGHAYMLQEVRRLSGADFLIILMSGDFVQRGTPAVFDKYVRTEMVLKGGADLVLELPLAASCGSARRFAEGAVRLLDEINIVDELWFGSETPDLSLFRRLAGILAEEPPEFRSFLKSALSEGLPFPAARETALRQYLDLCSRQPSAADGKPTCVSSADLDLVHALLSSPNNSLGLEYCIALQRAGSSIAPHTLQRVGSGYREEQFHGESLYPSATAVRAFLTGGNSSGSSALSAPEATVPSCGALPKDTAQMIPVLSACIPASVLPLYQRELNLGSALTEDDFSSMLLYRLREDLFLHASESRQKSYLDVSVDFRNRVRRLLPEFRSFSQFAYLLKSRNLTRTQVNRSLLHILLQLTDEDTEESLSREYVRVLGMRSCPELLSRIKKESKLTLVTRASALSHYQNSYQKDLFASELYESVKSLRTGRAFQPEYSRPVLLA